MILSKKPLVAELEQVKSSFQLTTQTSISDCCSLCDHGWVEENGRFRKCVCQEQHALKKRWQRFGVDPDMVKTIKEYAPQTLEQNDAKSKTISYLKEFSGQSSIAFLGQPGAGKTHLSLAIGKALIEQGKSVLYMPYLEAVRELKSKAMSDELYNEILNRYVNAKILIIDDLFKDKVKQGNLVGTLSEADVRHIYPVINQRYINKLPTIFSSECSAKMLLELDEALGSRILEMCKNNICNFSYAASNNYRAGILIGGV